MKSPHYKTKCFKSGTYTQECFQIYFHLYVVWKLLLSVHLPYHQEPVYIVCVCVCVCVCGGGGGGGGIVIITRQVCGEGIRTAH